MAAKHAYDLVVAKGEYQDKSGNSKKQWLTIGRMYANDKGYFLVLEPHINLAGLPRSDRGGVMVSCFEPRPMGGSPSSSNVPTGGGGASRPFSDFDDDIPF